MAKPDMSSRAVTLRLRRTEQLRRLCVALAHARRRRAKAPGEPPKASPRTPSTD